MHIVQLTLASTALREQEAFYSRLLERSALSATQEQICFQIGSSQLCFQHSAKALPGKYHLAFTIPENQFEEAIAWLCQYASLLQDSTGNQQFYSEQWHAHIVYFCDAEGNILELIARHSLANASAARFSAQSLLNISEIGVACDDFATLAADLDTRLAVTAYHWSGSDTFMPLGDANGLLIIVKPGRIWFPDTGLPALHVPVTVELENAGARGVWRFGSED